MLFEERWDAPLPQLTCLSAVAVDAGGGVLSLPLEVCRLRLLTDGDLDWLRGGDLDVALLPDGDRDFERPLSRSGRLGHSCGFFRIDFNFCGDLDRCSCRCCCLPSCDDGGSLRRGWNLRGQSTAPVRCCPLQITHLGVHGCPSVGLTMPQVWQRVSAAGHTSGRWPTFQQCGQASVFLRKG